jgi:hypothetical protein
MTTLGYAYKGQFPLIILYLNKSYAIKDFL